MSLLSEIFKSAWSNPYTQVAAIPAILLVISLIIGNSNEKVSIILARIAFALLICGAYSVAEANGDNGVETIGAVLMFSGGVWIYINWMRGESIKFYLIIAIIGLVLFLSQN